MRVETNGLEKELASAGELLAGLSFGNEELSKHVASQTSTGVKRGQCEDGDRKSQQGVGGVVDRVGEVCNAAEGGGDHGGNAAGEDGGRCGEEELLAAADGGLLEDNTDCDKGDDCQSGLDDHCAVADDLCVLLRVESLGGGTGTDERVEAGDSAAGDGDEQGREEACVAVEAAPACEGGQINVSAGEEDTDDSNDHHAVEQEGAEVVTRLDEASRQEAEKRA